MRGPELAEMNAFVTVAERCSFAKAAVQLGISRSRLSETIRELEGRLGVRLLNRTTRSVAPTAAGERLLAQIRPLLDDFGAVLDSINAYRDKPAGLLRLTDARSLNYLGTKYWPNGVSYGKHTAQMSTDESGWRYPNVGPDGDP